MAIGAGHQEVAAGQFGVEPEARLGLDRQHLRRADRAAQGAEVGDHTLAVVLHETGVVGLGPVHDHLDLWIAARCEVGREALRDDHDAANRAAHQRLLELAAVAAVDHVERGRGLEGRSDPLRDRRHPLDDDADAGARGVERDRVAEEEQEQHRQDQRDEDAARVAQDLPALLADQRREPAQAAGPGHAAAFTSASEAATRAMNASSMVGSGIAAVATLALSSSGEPSGDERPR